MWKHSLPIYINNKMTQTQQSLPINQQAENYSYRQRIKQFSDYLEKGDLATATLIPYGFVLYGFTKVAKTSTSHLLSGNVLRGFKQKGREMVQTVTSRNSQAKIGNTMNSQTVIPNKFEIRYYTVNGQIVYIIDTPGYGDSYGILKILANGFFHFRLYSKIKNMKFLICFDSIHLRNTGRQVVQTILHFTKSFKDYSEHKNQIWNSCCFLVTKVDPNEDTLETITQKFQTLVNTLQIQEKPETLNLIKNFIRQMIDKQKIFIVKKLRAGESSNEGHLLSMIDKKVEKWFTRKISSQRPDEVDMSTIVFALGKDIIVETMRNEISKDQFAELVHYYNNKTKQFIGSTDSSVLKRVFDLLVKDALGAPFSRQFLKPMAQYVRKNYPEQTQSYKDQRQKEENRLFQTNSSVSNSQSMKKQKNIGMKIKPKNYPIKKMNALRKIEELRNLIHTKKLSGRDILWIEECEVILYQILQELAKACYSANDRKKIVYPFGYLVRRIIEETKVFILLLQKYSTPEIKNQIKQISNDVQIDIFRPLVDFNGLGFKYEDSNDLQYSQLHSIFVNNFDPESQEAKDLEITNDFVEFFSQVQVDDFKTKEKIAKITLKFANQTLNNQQREVTSEQKHQIVQKLTKSFCSCKDTFLLTQAEDDKKKTLSLLRKLGSSLGRVLVELKQYDLARKIYDSINSVHSVCKIYKQQIDELDNSEQSSIVIRLQYGKYLAGHSRENEAIVLLQETYELAQIQELDKICGDISEMIINIKSKGDGKFSDYQDNIFNKGYFQSPSQEIFDELKSLLTPKKKMQQTEKIEEIKEKDLEQESKINQEQQDF